MYNCVCEIILRILFGVMCRVKSQMLKFLNFVNDCLLRNVVRQREIAEE